MYRELRPAEEVDKFVELFPDACHGCGRGIPRTSASLQRVARVLPWPVSEDDVPTVIPTVVPGVAAARPSDEVTDVADDRPNDPGSDAPPKRGDNLGPFVVMEILGSGAMDVVLRAFDPELDRTVAIKVMNQGLGGERAHARFVREARAAAQLQHPNVVAVYQAGTHRGRAYVVMECVESGTLRHWHKQRVRRWSEVVAVFIEAGRGLQAAHEAGLVHRDFKPDNVLIDGSGRPRISDFGLVSQTGDSIDTLDPESELRSGSARLTQTGAVLGTPAYMAPEQIRGGPIDARADQFSFCVAMYEALWNARPFAADSIVDLVERLRAPSAAPPSRPVPRRVRAAVIRGLAFDPADRHPDMASLIEELTAAIGNYPVRRWAFGPAAIAAVVGVVGVLAWPAAEIPSQCASVEDFPAAAWTEARANAITDAFERAPSTPRLDGDVSIADAVVRVMAERAQTLRQMMLSACAAADDDTLSPIAWDQQRRCLSTHDAELIALQDALARVDTKTKAGALVAVLGVSSSERCSDEERQPGYSVAPETQAEHEARTEVWRLEMLAAGGQTADVVAEGAALLPRLRALGVGDLLARTVILRAQAGAHQGPSAAGDVELREAIVAAAQSGDSIDEARASALLLSRAVDDPGRASEAEGLAAATEAAAQRSADPRTHAFVHMAMAKLEAARGDVDAALARVQSTIDLGEGAGLRPDEFANALCMRAAFRRGRDDAGAVNDLQRARAHAAEVLGADHPAVGLNLLCLGAVHLRAERLQPAYDSFNAAASILERGLGKNSSNAIAALVQLGRTALQQSRTQQARDAYQKAQQRCATSEQCDARLQSTILENLAWVELATRRYTAAAAHYRQALTACESLPDDADTHRMRVQQYLGYTHSAAGDYAEAGEAFAQMRKAAVALHGPKHPMVIWATNLAANAARAGGDCDAARQGYQRALGLRRDLALPPGPYLAEAMAGMGACELDAGDDAAAAESLASAYELRDSDLEPDIRAQILFQNARLRARQGDREEAKALAEQARTLLLDAGVPRDLEIAAVDAWLERR